MAKLYNYFYKITNNINNHFYYGIHSTDNINDSYMGSGYRLQYAYKKYGIENFTKEIIKFFDTREECAQYEADMVTETLVLDDNCYNIKLGGEGWNTQDMIPVFDKVSKNKTIIHKDIYYANKDRYDLIGCDFSKNVLVKDKNSNSNDYHIISREEYYKNTQLYDQYSSNMVVVKDKNGNMFRVSKDDERYKNGELTFIWKDKHHTQETKQKIKDRCKQTNFHKGETNPMFGKRWIHKDDKSILINNIDIEKYINDGWKTGKAKTIHIDPTKPTLEYLNDLYSKLHNWKLVAEHVNMSISALKHLRLKYKKLQ